MASTQKLAQQVAVVAVIKAAPGKLERLKEVLQDASTWIEDNEPGTLEFSIYEQKSAEGDVTLAIIERYADQAAVEKHRSSENYKKVFGTMSAEALLEGAPTIIAGQGCGGFQR